MAVDLLREIVFRWTEPDPRHVPLLLSAGATAVVPDASNSAFEGACTQAGLRVVPASEIVAAPLKSFGDVPAGKTAVLSDGIWPGATRPERGGDPEASASRDAWVDANGYLVACLKALYPTRPPILGFAPPDKGDKLIPFDTHELALIESWTSGGNYVMSVEPRFRKQLLASDAKAIAAWKNLGNTAKWLKANQTLFQGQVMPIIATLIDGEEASTELVNLMYRRNVSPKLFTVDRLPKPNPSCLEVVAADIKAMESPARAKILAHAEAGASVVITTKPDPGWKKVKSQEDRDFYQVGRGQVVAYHEAIADPNEFALDVIDVVSHRQRAVRVWNANAALAIATVPPPATEAKALMIVVNYGSPAEDVQTRIQGIYSTATMLRPEAPPITLKTYKRGNTTEVFLPDLKLACVVKFA